MDNELITLITRYILKAIENKDRCYVSMKNSGVSMYSYQDKIGIAQYLELYMDNTDGRNGYLILGLVNEDNKHREGSISISWDKVRHAFISQNYDRTLIKIDDLEINFLDKHIL